MSDAGPLTEAEILVRLLFRHCNLVAMATTPDQIANAFIPLLLARSLFNFSGNHLMMRPPSKSMRMLRAEAKKGWRSYEVPHRLAGRPRGTALKPARKFVDEVISLLGDSLLPSQRQHLESWLLAPGTAGMPGRRGNASDGARAFMEALGAEMRAIGRPENEIRRYTTDLRSALDDRRRNKRTRS